MTANEMRRELAQWMDRPVTEIAKSDVKSVIAAIAAKGATAQAHAIFGMVRTFFNWCVDSGDYGLETSPCARIKPTVLIGERNIRSRVLKDFEIAAYWRASETLGYPLRPVLQASYSDGASPQ